MRIEQPFPKESTPQSTHLFVSKSGASYDVYKLIDHAKDIKPVKVEVLDLEGELNRNCWIDTTGQKFSPQDLLSIYATQGSLVNVRKVRPEWRENILKIDSANYTDYPILIYNYTVVDGMHRLLKAKLDGVKDMYVKILDKLPESTKHP
ncbi:hypothetical protein BH10BAC1_BH10BAC1_16620 [soil metagenome]